MLKPGGGQRKCEGRVCLLWTAGCTHSKVTTFGRTFRGDVIWRRSHIFHNLMITVSTVTSSFWFQLELGIETDTLPLAHPPPSPPSLLSCYVLWLVMEDEHLRAPSIWDGLILLDIRLMVSWHFWGMADGKHFFFSSVKIKIWEARVL